MSWDDIAKPACGSSSSLLVQVKIILVYFQISSLFVNEDNYDTEYPPAYKKVRRATAHVRRVRRAGPYIVHLRLASAHTAHASPLCVLST